MAQCLTNTFLQPRPLLTVRPPPSKNVRTVGSFRQSSVTCRKKDIHPKFYEDAKVYCNGELVMTTGGTQKEYVVDVWSGNHPYYLGNRTAVLMDDDQVAKFRRKFGDIKEIMEIPVLKGEIVIPSRSRGISPKKGGAGKKK